MNKPLILAILFTFGLSMAQEEMTLEQYDVRLREARERAEVSLPKLAQLKNRIVDIKDEIETVNGDSRAVWKDILELVGITRIEYDEFVTSVENLQSEINSIENYFANDFPGWTRALKEAELKVTELKNHKIAAIPRVERMFGDIEGALASSRAALRSAKENAEAPASSNNSYSDAYSSSGGGTHTVAAGNSLWRIARMPENFGDPSRWPDIYRANQDKIQDPNLIFPGQVLEIPR